MDFENIVKKQELIENLTKENEELKKMEKLQIATGTDRYNYFAHAWSFVVVIYNTFDLPENKKIIEGLCKELSGGDVPAYDSCQKLREMDKLKLIKIIHINL